MAIAREVFSGLWEGVLEVVCAVVIREGAVLLCRRAAGMHLAGHWEFPGGKVEPGEDDRVALQREIQEELGCEVEVGASLPVVEHRYDELSIRLRPFRCVVEIGVPRALEHEEVAWFDPEAIRDLELAAADRRVWDEVCRAAWVTGVR